MSRTIFSDTCATFNSLTEKAGARLEAYGICERRNAGLLLAAAACALLPLKISHLASMVVGVLAYMLLQTLQPKVIGKAQLPRATKGLPSKPVHPWRATGAGARRAKSGFAEQHNTPGPGAAGTGPGKLARAGRPRAALSPESQKSAEIRKPSAMPVVAPTFKSVGWGAEVEELLGKIRPTTEGDATVESIARTVELTITSILPEAEVAGFATGNIAGGTAFGVAVPEVDIVISVNPTVLLGRLQGRWMQGRSTAALFDTHKLQKSAIRACTDRLVGTAGFKFRRSAFRGTEPKVTIIAPTGGPCGQGVPVNLSVNSTTPLYNAALLAESGRLEPLAKDLILLVKRWAKDRGLCHAAKGHLSPYAWTLLVIFFLQVRDTDEGPLLPPLEGFETCSGLMACGRGRAAAPWTRQVDPTSSTGCSAGSLFKDFVHFYAAKFDWRNEAISVRLGRRGPPDHSLPLHIVDVGEVGGTEVGPSVEDPFETSQNLGACTTAASLAHLREELQRAEQLCAGGVSLSQFLDPWAPPEAVAGQQCEEQQEEH